MNFPMERGTAELAFNHLVLTLYIALTGCGVIYLCS